MAHIELFERFRALSLTARVSLGKSATNYNVEILSLNKVVASFTIAKYLGAGQITLAIDAVDCVAYVTSVSRGRNINSYVGDYCVTLYGVAYFTSKNEAVRDLNNWHTIASVTQPSDSTTTTAKNTTTTTKKNAVVWTFVRDYRGAKLYQSDDKKRSKWEAEGIEYINHSSQTLVETFVCSPLNVDCLSIQQVKEELEITVPFYSDLKHIEAERTIITEFRKITAKSISMVAMAKELAVLCLGVMSDKDLDEVYDKLEIIKQPEQAPANTPNTSSVIHLPGGVKI